MQELDRNDIKTQEDADIKARQRATKRIAQIKDLWEKNTDEAQDELNELPLSISKEYKVKIELSAGGDADGFILTFKDKELVGGVLFWADWYKYAEAELTLREAELINEAFSAYLLIEE